MLPLTLVLATLPPELPLTLVLATQDYPPYAYMTIPPTGDFVLAGMGRDIASGLMDVCPELKISVRQTTWRECWDGSSELNSYGQGPQAGDGLEEGFYHGCMTCAYAMRSHAHLMREEENPWHTARVGVNEADGVGTVGSLADTHTTGVRNRYVEFTDGFLQANKPAGLLTRLNSNGVPHVLPSSTLDGLTIVDVSGWAPTADGLSLVENKCTRTRYGGYTMVTPAKNGNDAAMEMLMSGAADAMWGTLPGLEPWPSDSYPLNAHGRCSDLCRSLRGPGI